MANTSEEQQENPCGDFGPTQQFAFVWFVVVIAIGCVATWGFSVLDRFMWENDAEFVLDYDEYTENRVAVTSIPSERVDPRAHGDLATAAESSAE